MSYFPVIETERLLLRELVDADAADLFVIHGNAEAMRWFGSDPLADLDAARAVIVAFAHWRKTPNPGIRWGIERKSDGRLLGSCGLFAWNRSWKKCSTGYELGVYAQGHGYMREALSAAFAWGFEHMELHRIEAQIHPMNAASLKLAESLGFVKEGLLREVGYWSGQHHDLLQLGLLRREFRLAGAASMK